VLAARKGRLKADLFWAAERRAVEILLPKRERAPWHSTYCVLSKWTLLQPPSKWDLSCDRFCLLSCCALSSPDVAHRDRRKCRKLRHPEKVPQHPRAPAVRRPKQPFTHSSRDEVSRCGTMSGCACQKLVGDLTSAVQFLRMRPPLKRHATVPSSLYNLAGRI
jgi:hypothetical protein